MGKSKTSTTASYTRAVYNFIALYRYFSFALAVLIMAIWPRFSGNIPDAKVYFILGIIALLTLYKIIWPRYELWRINPLFLAGGEMALILAMMVWTGGLASGLLLYSVAPLTAAALLYEMKLSLGLAILASVAVLSAHLLLRLWISNLAWLLEGNYVIFFIFYNTGLLIIATITYKINLNLKRRLEEEAIAVERRRISWEIHDGLAQSLSYLRMQNLLALEKLRSKDSQEAINILGKTSQIIQEAYYEVREAIELFRQDPKRPFLVETLPAYIQEFANRYGLKAEIEVPSGQRALSPLVELQILGIVIGALSNIGKHAQARMVWVRLSFNEANMELTIRDDGRGFQPELALGKEDGVLGVLPHGLTIMQERAAEIGGKLSIKSVPGKGSEVKLAVPWKGVK